MLRVTLFLLAATALPWVLDTLYRWAWSLAARLPRNDPEEPLTSLLVLIPSRDEGEQVRPTLESVLRAEKTFPMETVLLLDGSDPVARGVARELGVTVVEKTPPGPTKAAVLRFAAEALRDTIAAHQAVMVLDVGSRVAPNFFQQLRWPRGAMAMQALLVAEAGGPGEGAALSEHLAQAVWDRGKEALGWNVKLRGTGTVFRSQVFLEVVRHICTQTEDTEASFLLAARGLKTALVPSAALVIDQKPSSAAEASRQRARWLAGQWGVLRHHWTVFFRFFARRPLEALSWWAMLLSRPLSLTTPLRVVAGLCLVVLAPQVQSPALGLWGAVVMGTAIVETTWLVLAHPRSLGPILQLGWSWLRAVALSAKGERRWYRARGPER